MKAKHCGECRLFKNEDINGDGWCIENRYVKTENENMQ